MRRNDEHMITLKQAQQQMIASVSCVCDSEEIALEQALNRVSSSPVVSSIFVPPSDNSAMDGFAVKVADGSLLADGSLKGKTLAVSQRIPAGLQPEPLQEGTAARIFTGGVMPLNADAVVIQESCYYVSDDEVTINVDVSSGDNVRLKGQDIAQGSDVIAAGQRLNAIDLSLIASVGCAKIDVHRPLIVAIFSTGDELVEPGDVLREGQIYNSNRIALTALCKQLGYQVIDCGIIEDTLEATKEALQSAAAEADIVISSGGVSVGEEDHVKPAVESLGSLDLWKVQMKPGKPVAFGRINKTPFLGLPGNPVSSYIVFQLLGVPLLAKLQGEKHHSPAAFEVCAGFEKMSVSREEYLRVRLINENGELIVQRFDNQSSGVLFSLAWADGLVRQNIGQRICMGSKVDFLPLHHGLL